MLLCACACSVATCAGILACALGVLKVLVFKVPVQIQELSRSSDLAGRLHWLDLFDDLLTPDGLRMKPCLHLDGTHMNPFYVEIIERALARC